MYLEKSRRRRLRIGVALCRTCAPHTLGPSHGLSTLQHSTAEPLEKFCDHWHQGTVVTAVTTFGGGTGPKVVGIDVRFLLCLWREPRGAPLHLGDGGDGGDENHNLLGGFTAADRSPTGGRAFSQTERRG
jgi:hypothetical protein